MLCATGLSLRQLFQLDLSLPEKLPPQLNVLPKRSLYLLFQCVKHGHPVVGTQQASRQRQSDIKEGRATTIFHALTQCEPPHARNISAVDEYLHRTRLVDNDQAKVINGGSNKKSRIIGPGELLSFADISWNDEKSQHIQQQRLHGTEELPHFLGRTIPQCMVTNTDLQQDSHTLAVPAHDESFLRGHSGNPLKHTHAFQDRSLVVKNVSDGAFCSSQLVGNDEMEEVHCGLEPVCALDNEVYHRSMQWMQSSMGNGRNFPNDCKLLGLTGPMARVAVKNHAAVPRLVNSNWGPCSQKKVSSPPKQVLMAVQCKQRHQQHVPETNGFAAKNQGLLGEGSGWCNLVSPSQYNGKQNAPHPSFNVTNHSISTTQCQPSQMQHDSQHQPFRSILDTLDRFPQQTHKLHRAPSMPLHNPAQQLPSSQNQISNFGKHAQEYIWASHHQQHVQQDAYDEFGVSLEPSITDAESDHDDTMAAQLSHLGLGREQNLHTVLEDPISALVNSRPNGFAAPRLSPSAHLTRGGIRNTRNLDRDELQSAAKRRGAFAKSVRNVKSRTGGGKKKLGRSCTAANQGFAHAKGLGAKSRKRNVGKS